MFFIEDTENDIQPVMKGTLTSFGSQANGKVVKIGSVTLQGTINGSSWTTLSSDTYRIRKKTGYIEKRESDDNGDVVDWSTYFDYQDLGNQAFRVTYTVKNGATETTYTNQSISIIESDPYIPYSTGGVDGEVAENLVVEEIHANYGDIGGWILSSTQFTSGNVFIDSSVPAIGLGATAYQTGTGFWVGNVSGTYKLSIGDATSKQLYWDGTSLKAGGWTIGATSLVSGTGATTVGMDSGGSNPAFYAGSATPTTAPAQIYQSGYAFFQDVVLAKGSLTGASGETGYGYAVGEPLFLCHFDGPRPYETDYRGSAIGHKGQVDTRSGGVIFRKGIFGKAVQIAEATTNYVLNPSAETTSNYTARGTATVTRDTATYYVGATSYKVVLAAANDGVDLTLSALANAAHYVTFWVSGSAISTLQVSLDGTNWNAITQSFTETIGGNVWTRCAVSISSGQANGSTSCRIRNTASSGTFYIDAAQVEQKAYSTPYCDGSLGLAPGQASTASEGGVVVGGHSWSGTKNASTSSRTATTLTYASSSNINLIKGSVSFWARINTAMGASSAAVSAYIDANNYFGIKLANLGVAGRIIAESGSGGTGVDTSSGASLAASGWHHVVMTWESGSLKCYVDGAQSGATANYVAPTGTLTTIEIGTKNSAQTCNTMIDDVAILPYVLTLNEIKSIYYSTAPLMLGVSNQEFRLSGAGLGDVFGNANGLFGRASDGTPSFGIVNGTVNATTWGGASETFDSGDYMFGSNASGKGNQIFDASTGTLALRTATTKKISLDSNGTVLIGADTSAAATNALAIFSGSVTYNSESMASGDILIGNNTSGASNLKIGSGGMAVRTGTTIGMTVNARGIDPPTIRLPVGTMTVTSGTIDIDPPNDGVYLTSTRVYITSSTGNFTIRGIKTPTDDGHVLFLINDTSNNMTFLSGGSPAAGWSKITTFGTGSPATTAAGCAILIYSLSNDRWDLFSIYG